MISRTAAAALGFHRENRMSVAILGGGLQGCCAALALATRGIRVTLYERNSTLLAGAATANEGKIHLGYRAFDWSGGSCMARGRVRGRDVGVSAQPTRCAV